MNAVEREILERLKALLARGTRLHRLFLFGSRARGDADPDSDMDVLVVLAEPVTPEKRRYISECAWEAGFERGIVVVPVAYSRDEWESGPESQSLLAQAVAAEGILI